MVKVGAGWGDLKLQKCGVTKLANILLDNVLKIKLTEGTNEKISRIINTRQVAKISAFYLTF